MSSDSNVPADPPSESDELDEQAHRRSSVDQRGVERPRFILDLPEDPTLTPLIEAFEAGNYAFVRANAEQVAQNAQNPEVREAALELRRRIDPDPLAAYLLFASVLLLVFLVVWVYAGHNH